MTNKTLSHIFLFILFSLLISSILVPISATAAAKCTICGGNHDDSSLAGIRKYLYEKAEVAYGSDPFGFQDADPNRTTVSALILFDIENNGALNKMWYGVRDEDGSTKGGVQAFYGAASAVGIILCTIAAMTRILEEYTGDNLTPEKLVMLLIKWAGNIFVILWGFRIATSAMHFGTALFKILYENQLTYSGDGSKCPYSTLTRDGFWYTFSVWTDSELKTNSFIMSVARLFSGFVCWIRAFDIMTRVMFMPIGIHGLLFEGMNGSGFRYIRKLFASAAQSGLLFCVFLIFGYIKAAVFNGSGNPLSFIIFVIATCTLLFHSKEVADDILGA